MIEWSLFRLGPKNDWCLHLWGCIWQWKHLDFTLPGCLVCRNAGWVVQAYGSVSVLRLSCFVSLLRFHAPGIPYGLFLPLSELAHWGGGSPGPWSLPPLTCLHRVWCAVSFLSLSNPHRVCAFICPWVLWWPPNLGSCKQCCHKCCTVSLFSSWSLSRYRSILWFPALVVRLFGRFSINRFVLHFVFCFYGQRGPRTDGTFPSRPCPGATVGPLFWEWLFWLVGVHPTSRMWFALLQ